MRIITISGVDGSGKSTQINLLKKTLEDRGERVYYFHAVQFSIANSGKNRTTTPGEAKAVTRASWYKIQLRKAALVIDLVRFEILLSKLTKDGYTTLVSDRYFYDGLLNILYLSRGTRLCSFAVHLLAKLAPVPSTALYLRVSPATIVERERKVEQGTDYLEQKSALFEIVAQRWGLQTISGDGSIEDVQQRILKSLE